jgi:putative sterol carrier protein
MTVGNTDSDADTTLRISAEDLDALLRGELNAMNAYMQGRLVVDGDLTKALQLSNLFG